MPLPLPSMTKPLPAASLSGSVFDAWLRREALGSPTKRATYDGSVWFSNPSMLVESSAAAGVMLVSMEKSRCGGAALHPTNTRIADTQMELRKDDTWHIHHHKAVWIRGCFYADRQPAAH